MNYVVLVSVLFGLLIIPLVVAGNLGNVSANILPTSFKTIVKDWVGGKTRDEKFIQTIQNMIKQDTQNSIL